jgi:hypothetical protein
MPTLNEITYNIKNIIEDTSDDAVINVSQLKFIINYHRAELIRQDLTKKRKPSGNIIQTIGCVELEEADPAECCLVDTQCVILRTKKEIPKPIEVYQQDMITGILTVDEKDSFQLTSAARNRWRKHSQWTSKVRTSYYLNNRIYITNDRMIELIKIRGVFEDPTKLAEFENCDGSICYDDDSEYPISNSMLPLLMQRVLSLEMQVLLQSREDIANNTQEDGNLYPPQR